MPGWAPTGYVQTIHLQHGTWIAHAVRFQINILKKNPYWETTHDWTSFAGPADVMFWLRQFAGLSAHLQVLVTLRRNKCRATHHKYAHLQLSESTGSQGKLKMASSQCAYKKNTKRPNQAMWQSMTDMYTPVPQSTNSKSQAEVNRAFFSAPSHTKPCPVRPIKSFCSSNSLQTSFNRLPIKFTFHGASSYLSLRKFNAATAQNSCSSRAIEGKLKLGSCHMNLLEIQDSMETFARNDVNKWGKASEKEQLWSSAVMN